MLRDRLLLPAAFLLLLRGAHSLPDFVEDFAQESALSPIWRPVGPAADGPPNGACFVPGASSLIKNDAYVLSIRANSDNKCGVLPGFGVAASALSTRKTTQPRPRSTSTRPPSP